MLGIKEALTVVANNESIIRDFKKGYRFHIFTKNKTEVQVRDVQQTLSSQAFKINNLESFGTCNT